MADFFTIDDVDTFDTEESKVFYSLLQQMKTPFLQMRHEAELGHTLQETERFKQIQVTADAALGLLDNYMLSLRLQCAGPKLELEPVALSSVLNEVAHALHLTARAYDTDIRLTIGGRYEPVIAHKAGLFAALTSLGYVLLQVPQHSGAGRVIELNVHRTKSGVAAGLYANTLGIDSTLLRKAHALTAAHQPLGGMSNLGGAGVFIADSLFASMQSKLRVSRHHRMTGLVATFTPSQQMSLV